MQKQFFTSIDPTNYGKQSPSSAQYENHRASTGGLSPNSAESPKAQVGYQRYSLAQYSLTPPPPYPRRNVFDTDANAVGSFRTSGANNTVYGSPSPDNEQRFAPTPFQGRPSSAHVQRPNHLTETIARPASTVAMPPPPPQATSKSTLITEGATVIESDPGRHTVIASYRCGKLLGSGGFASVYEFVDQNTNVVYACKVIDRAKQTSSSMKNIQMEISIHKALRHPNIIQFVKSFYDDLYVYILMERCADKNLLDISNARKTLSVPEVQHIISQLCSAIEYMHVNRIVHRDIKLGNILLDSTGNVKLGDFGFANTIGKEKKTRVCGTPNYMAPEIISCTETKRGYSFEVDLWSVGVILYILTCGVPPFQAGSVEQVYEKIKRVDFSIPDWVTRSCADLISQLLQLDPGARPTTSQIRMSAFMQGYSSANLAPVHFLRSTAAATGNGGVKHAMPVLDRTGAGTAPRSSPIMEPSPDALSPVQALGKRSPSSRSSRHGAAPPPPSVFIDNLVFFNKYGHGFSLCTPTSHAYATLLNDNTKMLLREREGLVCYYDRLCYSTVDNARGRVRCFSDDAHLFRFDDVDGPLRCDDQSPQPTEQVAAGARKKFAITKFFMPHLNPGGNNDNNGVDATNMTQRRSVFQSKLFTSSSNVSMLFPDAQVPTDTDHVYVKEVVLDSCAKLCPSPVAAADMDLFAVRFSDSSFQVHVQCGADTPVSMAPETQTPLVQPRTPWSFDVLLYGRGHILFGFETEHTLFYQVVCGPTDSFSVGGGKRFEAYSSTSNHTQLFLSNQLLTLIKEVLVRVKCSSPLLDYFAI